MERSNYKLFKQDKLQLAGSAPLHILANYNLPLNRVLACFNWNRGNQYGTF